MKVYPCNVVLKRFCSRLILLGILMVPAAAFGQPAQQLGEIIGTVRNVIGQELPGASIMLSASEGNETPRIVITDSNGRYRLVNVLYGTYTLAATLTGFTQSDTKSLTVVSVTETVDFTLAPLSRAATVNSFESGSIASAAKSTPTFSAAGIQGTTAPSGYSAAASAEEASQVMDRIDGLDEEILSEFPPGESLADCNKEADLLVAAHANPKSFDTNHALGIFYFGHGDFIQSIRYLKLASGARPADTNNSRELALAYIDAKQYSDAVASLQRITERESRDPVSHRLLAVAYKASGNPQKSVAEYLWAAGLDAGEQNIFQCGIGLIGLGSAGAAAKLFSSATVTHPGSASLWMGLGIAQDLQHLKIDSIRSLLHAIDVDPEFFPPYSFLATLAGTSAETDTQIRRRLSELVVAHPESSVAHYDYALALGKQRRLSPDAVSSAEIESQLRFAVTKDPKMARAHFQLGVFYAESGDYVSATNELRETVQLEPGNGEAHYRLAQAYRRDKQPGLADLEIRKFEAMHGNVAGEDSSGADIQKLAPQLSHQTAKAAPCHEANH
jgi:Flp pilus assembly protein TadD